MGLVKSILLVQMAYKRTKPQRKEKCPPFFLSAVWNRLGCSNLRGCLRGICSVSSVHFGASHNLWQTVILNLTQDRCLAEHRQKLSVNTLFFRLNSKLLIRLQPVQASKDRFAVGLADGDFYWFIIVKNMHASLVKGCYMGDVDSIRTMGTHKIGVGYLI